VTLAYLGLGSNLGDRQARISRALDALAQAGVVVCAVSPLYESEPLEVTDQPRFLNAACAIETGHSPPALLALLKAIEREMGRTCGLRHGPRPIDLDILLYGDQCIETPSLIVPHPAMLERAFVLVPLADIAPSVRHPRSGLSIAEHLCRLGPTPDVAPYPPGLKGRHVSADAGFAEVDSR
jgi:2-amino-4-hydroxy-6-hydroxymethyldihydropteridine diphosphokinase